LTTSQSKTWPPPGRIGCCVIGCRRTAPQDKNPGYVKIICGKCWNLAPRYHRRRVRLLERIARKKGVDLDSMAEWPPPYSIARRIALLHATAFDRLVASAIEVKVGISA
jgi:hypothetical protein